MPSLDEQILAATESIPGISALLVFGSRARGDARKDSDLDVAVLPEGGDREAGADPDAPVLDRDLRVRIAVALAELAPEGRVDVVLLDRAPDTLRQKIMVEGRMILCRDLPAWKALRVATMKEYGDREWARKVYREALKKRLAQRVNGG